MREMVADDYNGLSRGLSRAIAGAAVEVRSACALLESFWKRAHGQSV